MPTRQTDPLLAIARAVLWIMLILMALGAVICIAEVPLILFMKDPIGLHLPKGVTLDGLPHGFRAQLAALLTVAALLCAAVGLLSHWLLKIIAAVGKGDPFVPENATRLTQTAWAALAMALLNPALGVYGYWLTRQIGISGQGEASFHISPEGILLSLILFVVVRVFRLGTRMRQDLEGTV